MESTSLICSLTQETKEFLLNEISKADCELKEEPSPHASPRVMVIGNNKVIADITRSTTIMEFEDIGPVILLKINADINK